MIQWHSFFFLLFGLVACVFALAVVFTNNVVRMAFYLVMSLGATAGLFFLAGADFVGAMQLMIYVGGTLVLLVFGVMLTAQSPFISMKTKAGEWVASMFAGGLLLALLLTAAFNVAEWRDVTKDATLANQMPEVEGAEADSDAPVTATRLGLGLLGARVDQLEGVQPEVAGGLSGYLLPFEIVSVHLSRPKKRLSAGSHGDNP
jgi:NADH-quinone oxidoreductase subunit J